MPYAFYSQLPNSFQAFLRTSFAVESRPLFGIKEDRDVGYMWDISWKPKRKQNLTLQYLARKRAQIEQATRDYSEVDSLTKSLFEG